MRKTFKSLLSTSLALLLILAAIPSNVFAVNADNTGADLASQFKFSHLVNIDNDDVLIFTYLGNSAEGVEIGLTNENGVTEETISLTDGNTSAEFYNILPGDTYNYTVQIGEEEPISGTLSMTEDGVNYTPQQIMPLAAGQTFQAKNGTVNIKSSTTSLFRAIENARSSGISGASVVMNSTTTVFKMTNSTTYYKYQFDQYYGSTTSLTDAKKWITDYNYSHIINGAGQDIYDYLQNIKGGLTGISGNALIERNVGGYYYNFAKSTSQYKKMSIEVDLSNLKIKESIGDYNNNGYIFIGGKQSKTFETGLFYPGSGQSLYAYYMKGDGTIWNGSIIAEGTKNSSTNEISFSGKVRITLALSANQQTCTVENLTTGNKFSKVVDNPNVSGTAATKFLYAVSLVPDDPSNALNDLRSGSYMKNVKISKPTLYTSVSATTGSSALPTTSLSEYAFFYNTDCGSYSTSGSGTSTVETISIYYDSTRT